MVYYIYMNVKRATLIGVVAFFVFFANDSSLRAEQASGSYRDNCPEFEIMKNRPASIGGNAWNYRTQWIYNRFSGNDSNGQPYGVYKKGEKRDEPNRAEGNEIYGWSLPQWPDSFMEDPEHGRICWGETCEETNEGKPVKTGYDALDTQTFLDSRNDSFAKLDFDNREPFCHEVDASGNAQYSGSGDSREPVYKPCDEMQNKEKYEEKHDGKKIPAYCLYPLKGWMKIRGLHNEDEVGHGWTRLSGRIVGDNVPKELWENGKISDPGTFGSWENWKRDSSGNFSSAGRHLNCASNDPQDPYGFLRNKNACSYRVLYNPQKKEFYGWAWNPLVEWIWFSGSTLYDTREWDNKTWCDGPSCTEVNYDQGAKRSRWNTAYLGVWVKGIGGNLFGRKGFSGINPPPGEFNTDYLLITGRYTPSDDPSKKKQAGVDTWEGTCDDPRRASRSGCPPLADIFEQKRRKRETITSKEIFDISPPSASQRVNRSAIKRGTLGSLNADALFPKLPQQVGLAIRNVYGNNVKVITNESGIITFTNAGGNDSVRLDGTVYYYDGDLVIGADTDRKKWTILNTNTESANGTVVVRGNLIIKRPIEYDQQPLVPITNFRQLASLSWVVLKRDTPLPATDPRSNPPASVTGILTDDWRAGGNIVIDPCMPAHIHSKEGMGTGNPDYEYNRMLEYKKAANGDEVIENGKKVLVPKSSDEFAAVSAFFENQQFTVVSGSFFAENIFATGQGKGGPTAGTECQNLKIKYRTSTEESVLVGGRLTFDRQGNEIKEIKHTPVQELYYDLPLEIRGVVVAKKMLLQRVYRGVNRGSETIVNTGRALVNPPPGIAEFARALPLW